MYKSVLVVMPCFNEQRCAGGAVYALIKAGFGNVLVIDDGSRDNTGAVASRAGVEVITHSVNMGLGSAIRTGLIYAIDAGYKFVITFDGDGQMRAEDAVKVYEEAQKGYGFVYGYRNFDIAEIPRIRKYTNLLADALTALLSGKFVWDTQSGLRCMKVDLLRRLDLKSRGYSISSELIIESIKNGVTPKPVRIDAIYTKESLKKGQKVSNSFRVVKELLG